MNYRPIKVEELPGYVWHCAIPDCMAKPYILPSYFYDQLWQYSSRESQFYRGRWYKTEELAMKDLESSFQRIVSGVINCYNDLPVKYKESVRNEINKP